MKKFRSIFIALMVAALFVIVSSAFAAPAQPIVSDLGKVSRPASANEIAPLARELANTPLTSERHHAVALDAGVCGDKSAANYGQPGPCIYAASVRDSNLPGAMTLQRERNIFSDTGFLATFWLTRPLASGTVLVPQIIYEGGTTRTMRAFVLSEDVQGGGFYVTRFMPIGVFEENVRSVDMVVFEPKTAMTSRISGQVPDPNVSPFPAATTLTVEELPYGQDIVIHGSFDPSAGTQVLFGGEKVAASAMTIAPDAITIHTWATNFGAGFTPAFVTVTVEQRGFCDTVEGKIVRKNGKA